MATSEPVINAYGHECNSQPLAAVDAFDSLHGSLSRCTIRLSELDELGVAADTPLKVPLVASLQPSGPQSAALVTPSAKSKQA